MHHPQRPDRRARDRFKREQFHGIGSLRHHIGQIIDDQRGTTLAAASTLDAAAKGDAKQTKVQEAAAVGTLIGQRAKAAGVAQVVFDRAGFRYHGRLKALADAARAAGLEF